MYVLLTTRMVYSTLKGWVAVEYEFLGLGYHKDINNCFSGGCLEDP